MDSLNNFLREEQIFSMNVLIDVPWDNESWAHIVIIITTHYGIKCCKTPNPTYY